jgi:hypothetical protein
VLIPQPFCPFQREQQKEAALLRHYLSIQGMNGRRQHCTVIMETIVTRNAKAGGVFTAVQPRGKTVNDSLLEDNQKAKADNLTGLYLIFQKERKIL